MKDVNYRKHMPAHKLNVKDIRYRLKQLREAKNMSMRELASKSDLSVSLISKVEAGKISPTVMTLQKILDGLQVDLYDFLLESDHFDPSDQIVYRRKDMAMSEDDEHLWCYAFPKHPDIRMELTYEEYQPHTRLTESESHKGDICGMVLSGELTIVCREKAYLWRRRATPFILKRVKSMYLGMMVTRCLRWLRQGCVDGLYAIMFTNTSKVVSIYYAGK